MNKSLQIVFFASYNFPQGTYFRWHNLAIGLQKLGHKVQVLTFNKTYAAKEKEELIDGVLYHTIPSSKGQGTFGHNAHPMVIMKSLLRHIPKADVYHAFQPFLISTLPPYLNRSKAKLFVYDWDDLWFGGLINTKEKSRLFPDRISNIATRWVEESMPSKADLVTVCSSFLRVKALTHHAKKAEIVYNGFWEGTTISQIDARVMLGLRTDSYYFGFMGRTLNELDWCYDVLLTSNDPKYRLALCGMDKSLISDCPAHLINRIDFLGQLSPQQAKNFAVAINTGLLPLEDTTFNNSRFPIKFAEYLAADSSVICSNVGEVALLANKYGGVKLAGTTRLEWKDAISEFILEEQNGKLLLVNKELLRKELDWLGIARRLEQLYISNMQA